MFDREEGASADGTSWGLFTSMDPQRAGAALGT